jgi:hypothetical protein
MLLLSKLEIRIIFIYYYSTLIFVGSARLDKESRDKELKSLGCKVFLLVFGYHLSDCIEELAVVLQLEKHPIVSLSVDLPVYFT